MDTRVTAGTTRMLAARRAALDAGATHLGWKLGFGAPAAMAAFDTDRPLVGFLTRDRLLPSGATVDVGAWTKPMLEAEVAAHLGVELGPGAGPAEALEAVAGWSVAIELADLDVPPSDIEEILAGNIFHRHVLLGPVVDALPRPLTFTVQRDGEVVAATSDPAALTGDLGQILASTADTLAGCGASLAAGDVVITGSVVPPIDVSGGLWRVVSELGEVTASLALS